MLGSIKAAARLFGRPQEEDVVASCSRPVFIRSALWRLPLLTCGVSTLEARSALVSDFTEHASVCLWGVPERGARVFMKSQAAAPVGSLGRMSPPDCFSQCPPGLGLCPFVDPERADASAGAVG